MQILLDFSMSGFENGIPRIYTEKSPTITGRIYKEPYQILEIIKVDSMYENNTIAKSRAEQSRAEQLKECRLGNLHGATGGSFAGQIYDKDYLSPTLTDMQGGGRQPHIVEIEKMGNSEVIGKMLETSNSTVLKDTEICETKTIKIKQATKDGFVECEIPGIADLNYVSSTTRRGRVQENGKMCPMLCAENVPSLIELGDPDFYNFLYCIDGQIYLIRIRKLIPLECWRLMGFTDEDFHKAEKVNSNTQLYKQAGNSIVKNCLMAIYKQML